MGIGRLQPWVRVRSRVVSRLLQRYALVTSLSRDQPYAETKVRDTYAETKVRDEFWFVLFTHTQGSGTEVGAG